MLIPRLEEEKNRFLSQSRTPTENTDYLRQSLRELDREIAVTERDLAQGMDEISELNLLIFERDNLVFKLERYHRELETVQNSERFLSQAYENMCSKYLGKASSAFQKYTKLLGCGDGYSLDRSFRISKTEGGRTRENEYYSRGTKDMHSLALHLALCESLYGGNMPPLILDDPFISFDDSRLSSAKDMLRKLAKEEQIIYFTCSSHRML